MFFRFSASALLFTVLFSIVNPALADPFGFDVSSKTSPDETYDYCEKKIGKSYTFICKDAPDPHPDLETYEIFFIEGVGYCKISARGKNIFRFSNVELRDAVDNVAKYIESKYGDWTKRMEHRYGYKWVFIDYFIKGSDRIEVRANYPNRYRPRAYGYVSVDLDILCWEH